MVSAATDSNQADAPIRKVRACLLIIGNEILSGRTKDANLAFLGHALNEIGIQLAEARVIPELEYPLGGSPQRFPGIRYGDHVIWGLTLRILDSFAEIMERDLAVRY